MKAMLQDGISMEDFGTKRPTLRYRKPLNSFISKVEELRAESKAQPDSEMGDKEKAFVKCSGAEVEEKTLFFPWTFFSQGFRVHDFYRRFDQSFSGR